MPDLASKLEPFVERLGSRVDGGFPYRIRLWDGSEVAPTDSAGNQFVLIARSPKALEYLVHQPGELGLGRAWVSGELDLEGDLEDALRLGERFSTLEISTSDRLAAVRTARRLGGLHLRGPVPPESEAAVHGSRHSRRRDSEAVRHHYDVSNDFYRLVLGPSMVYSCAYFETPDDTLEQAQERKLDVICSKLQLQEGERLLDIGCGWGSLLIHAAKNYGVQAVGVTLSPPQAEFARARVREEGLSDQIEVRVSDYRDVADGPYDKIASVGMYEHVGANKLDTYMGQLQGLVRPGGLVLNHGITKLTSAPMTRDGFIDRYVFPDGELHLPSVIAGAMERVGFELRDVEALREHYPLTLRRWVANLAANRDEAIELAGEERERIWRLYMTTSAQAFDRAEIGVHQLLAAAPGAPHRLPLARPGVSSLIKKSAHHSEHQ